MRTGLVIRACVTVTYFYHLLQFLSVTSDEVKEGQAVKVLGPLVRHLYHLQCQSAMKEERESATHQMHPSN